MKSSSIAVNKKNRMKKRLAIWLAILLTISLLILWYFDTYVNPVILTTTHSKVKMLTSQAINSSVSELLNNSNVYDDLIDISYDKDGNINAILPNASQTNRLSKDITRLALLKIESIGDTGIAIPLGSFTGMPILMGRGPNIQIRISPIGTLQCNFFYDFTTAGINQTVHRIYLHITSDINLILPIHNNKVQTYTEVMLCESVIVGRIPEVYFGSNSISSLLDLVP